MHGADKHSFGSGIKATHSAFKTGMMHIHYSSETIHMWHPIVVAAACVITETELATSSSSSFMLDLYVYVCN